LILDTGPLVAALDRDDQDHQRRAELLATSPGPPRVPGPVLTELCYLLERQRGSGAEALFMRALATEELHLVAVRTADLSRMAELVTTYADLPLGAVDGSVLAIAERLDDLDVDTLDRRHFTILRPSRGRILTLHPAI
jgi:uncharacterized protein